ALRAQPARTAAPDRSVKFHVFAVSLSKRLGDRSAHVSCQSHLYFEATRISLGSFVTLSHMRPKPIQHVLGGWFPSFLGGCFLIERNPLLDIRQANEGKGEIQAPARAKLHRFRAVP